MRLLLDTHTWLWVYSKPERLSVAAMSSMEHAEELWVSPVSTWEAMMLGQRARVEMRPDPVSYLARLRRFVPARPLPLTHEIAIQSRLLEGFDHHQDPADRFIIATALVHDLTLVTSDRTIRAWGGVPAIW